ncbi:MAG: shikimate dehydrogenase [Dehalococcoidia bacterium]
MTKYVGLIGYPLGHSVSPAMQQAAFDYYKLDVRYEVWETEPSILGKALERLRSDSILGANVTVPHKESVIPLTDELDELAHEIGAVNTIVNRGGKLTGCNTDAVGFLRALRQEANFDPAGRQVVLLGAGGVARAVSFSLARAGARSLVTADIAEERAQRLASDLERSAARGQAPGLEIKALSLDDRRFAEALSSCDLVVNCTPIGMKGSATGGQSPLEASLIPGGALIYDVVYNPVETPLLADAKRAGAQTLGGLSMLVYQGAMAFELWTGKSAPVDIMMRVAGEAL